MGTLWSFTFQFLIKMHSFLFFRFSDKTKNDWYDRKNFSKVSGKYDLVAIDYGSKVGW